METENNFKSLRSAWGLLMVSAIIETLAITIIKVRFNSIGEIDFSTFPLFADYLRRFFQWLPAGIAIGTLMVSPLLPFIALSRLQLNIAYPVLAALHLFFVEIYSHLLLHEPAGIKKALGLCCILVSLFFFYSDQKKS